MEMREELDRAYEMNAKHVMDKVAITTFVDDVMSAYEMTFETLDNVSNIMEAACDDRVAVNKIKAMHSMYVYMHEAVHSDYRSLFGKEFE